MHTCAPSAPLGLVASCVMRKERSVYIGSEPKQHASTSAVDRMKCGDIGRAQFKINQWIGALLGEAMLLILSHCNAPIRCLFKFGRKGICIGKFGVELAEHRVYTANDGFPTFKSHRDHDLAL